MWEMILVGFINSSLIPYLKNVSVFYKATGFGKILGNKGGLMLSFSLFNHYFNFINVHLVHAAKNFE